MVFSWPLHTQLKRPAQSPLSSTCLLRPLKGNFPLPTSTAGSSCCYLVSAPIRAPLVTHAPSAPSRSREREDAVPFSVLGASFGFTTVAPSLQITGHISNHGNALHVLISTNLLLSAPLHQLHPAPRQRRLPPRAVASLCAVCHTRPSAPDALAATTASIL